jgi:deoxyribonuclease V
MLLPKSVIYNLIPRLQEMFASKIVQKSERKILEKSCGIDVSYKGPWAFASAVIMDSTNFEIIEIAKSVTHIEFPYIPGLFILREARPILHTMRLLKCDFDVLLLDGHGILHPRKCGLASFVGVLTNRPTIGIAKKLLCGQIDKDNFIHIDRKICGYMQKSLSKKPIYISIGNKISLKDSVNFVRKVTRESYNIPEPLRLSDIFSKNNCKSFFNK